LDIALLAGALLLGLAGVPHCAAMCGAGCAVAVGGARSGVATPWAFHLARIAGYAAAGGVAAASVGALALLGQWSPALRPLWTLLHVAALALGLWLLWHGRQPMWMAALGNRSARVAATSPGQWQVLRGPTRAGAIGAAWVAWPCGLLQSALVVAGLANSALGGAAVMAGFAAVTAVGLGVGPWLWRRAEGLGTPARAADLAVRLAGALLAMSSAWALGHGLWQRVLDWCLG